MKARPYDPKDFETIKAWGAQWGAEYRQEQFPKYGFIVDGLCAYFVYCTDSSICFLENLVKNKDSDMFDAHEALDLVIAACFNKAKELGYKVAYATTPNVFAAKRAREHGATALPLCLLLTKDLTT